MFCFTCKKTMMTLYLPFALLQIVRDVFPSPHPKYTDTISAIHLRSMYVMVSHSRRTGMLTLYPPSPSFRMYVMVFHRRSPSILIPYPSFTSSACM